MALVIVAAVSSGDDRPYNARLYWCSAAYAALLTAPLMPSLSRALAATCGIAIGTIILALRATPFLSRRRPDGTRQVGHNDLHWPPRWPGRPIPRVNRYDKRARPAGREKNSESSQSADETP
ncbi:hypothetical protein ABZ942_28745 [Nocardia sp. NPDC046473]|uniref:hypothetical protein n=1 Tax=Nocardia sp. NPDC046473 TaxID=3155733 RepID=UPI0033DA73E1